MKYTNLGQVKSSCILHKSCGGTCDQRSFWEHNRLIFGMSSETLFTGVSPLQICLTLYFTLKFEEDTAHTVAIC